MFRKIIVGTILLAGLALIAGILPTRAAPVASSAAQTSRPEGNFVFQAVLSGTNEVPSTTSNATGRMVIVLDNDFKTAHWRLMVSDILTPTAAHIHIGEPGVAGPIVFPLYTGGGNFGAGSPISGTLTLTPNQIVDLGMGRYYVNVHTAAHPTGEIRGQLLPFSKLPLDFSAPMDGIQETPPVSTTATGQANFRLNFGSLNLDYTISVSNIISITAAHIHLGLPGKPGPIVFPLYTGSGTFDSTHPLSGSITLNSENLLDLLTGYYYVNVHTTAHPTGEIRGQIGPVEAPVHTNQRGFRVFTTMLSGTNEVPTVTTSASGRAEVVLSKDESKITYRVAVSGNITPTTATINMGAPGSNGPVLFTLFSGSGEFGPGHTLKGSLPVTAEQAAALVAGNTYVNITTAAHPDGELRGQLTQFNLLPSSFRVSLTGGNSAGKGFGRFLFNPIAGQLNFVVTVTDLTNITNAFIRIGAPGQGGQTVYTLYSGGSPFDTSHPLTGVVDISDDNVAELLAGNLFLDIRTQSQPDGAASGLLAASWDNHLPYISNSVGAATP